jgi:hypothetical protein
MKSAVSIFHKNASTIYPDEWIDKCCSSIRNQTYRGFDVFEVNYGGDDRQLYEGSIFDVKDFVNYSDAQNYLLDKIFDLDYDCVFNVNIDDWYSLDRFEKQLPYISQGYDVVSSNYYQTDKDGHIQYTFNFDRLDIAREFNRNYNIIAHPVVCLSRNFWLNCDRYNPENTPNPKDDDFTLWKKSYRKGLKFVVLPDFLLFHRVHDNNVSRP